MNMWYFCSSVLHSEKKHGASHKHGKVYRPQKRTMHVKHRVERGCGNVSFGVEW